MAIEDWGGLLKQFPALMPGWEAHPQRHPPGLVLLFMGWRLLLERFPGVTSVLSNPLRLDQCNSSYLMFFDDAQLASAWIGMILPVLSSGVLVWPVYQLGRAFYGPRVSWWAAAWIPLLPSSVIFSPKPNQIYPVLCTMALSAFWYGLKKGKHIWFLVSGGLMSLSTFLSFTNLIYLAALGTLFGVAYYQIGRAHV